MVTEMKTQHMDSEVGLNILRKRSANLKVKQWNYLVLRTERKKIKKKVNQA